MTDGQLKDTDDVAEPEEIERDIERTRDELSVTIDAIADRVSPKRVASRGVASAKDKAQEALASVQQQVARLRDGSGDADGPQGTGATVYKVERRTPSPAIIAAAAAAGSLLLTLVVRRRRNRD